MNKKEIEIITSSINEFHEFLACDLYSKFRPEMEISGKTFVRDDHFGNEPEFREYLDDMIDVLKKQIFKETT